MIPTVGLYRDPRHRYYWNGDGPLAGVTTITRILNAPGLNWWDKEQVARHAIEDAELLVTMRDRGDSEAAVKYLLSRRDYGDAARERGTDFHQIAEQIDLGGEPEIPEYLDLEVRGYREWLAKTQPRFIAIEAMVCNLTYGYGGTADRWATIDGQVWLLDIKTSRTVVDARGRVYRDHRLQLAGYNGAEFIGKVNDPVQYPLPSTERFGIIHVTAEGTQLYEAPVGKADWVAFVSALGLYRWQEAA